MPGTPQTTDAGSEVAASHDGAPSDDAAWEIVRSHERSAGSAERRARGAFYTPEDVVAAIAAMAITPDWIPDRVIDPTCGAGAFLLGALDRLVAVGVDAAEALSRIHGIDIDAGAVDAARAAVSSWARSHALAADSAAVEEQLDEQIVVGEGQAGAALDWVFGEPEALDRATVLVLGNPPFATPLKGSPFPGTAGRFRHDNADLLGPYADLAAVHLAAVAQRCDVGDRIVLVVPQSLVSARDAEGLRQHLAVAAPVVDAWATPDRVFDANVRVWTPVLQIGAQRVDDRPWAAVLADALGGPAIDLVGEPLGPRIVATAGFRDEYYGLAGACFEAGSGDDVYRLATVGSLDPLWSWWGVRQTTFAKRGWLHPAIERSQLDEKVARWFARQCREKVLVPTQSKVFEPFVDRSGTVIPATPLLSVHVADDAEPLADGEPLTLDMLAAILLAPPIVAWARRRWFGAALSTTAIKVPASGLGELPMPADLVRWRSAAALIAGEDVPAGIEPTAVKTRSIVESVGLEMTEAYLGSGEGQSLYSWWLDRLPAIG